MTENTAMEKEIAFKGLLRKTARHSPRTLALTQ